MNSIQTNVASAQSYSSPMKTVYESDAMKTIREGVNTLVDSLPGLVKALDEVAKIHPFIGSASYSNIQISDDNVLMVLSRICSRCGRLSRRR